MTFVYAVIFNKGLQHEKSIILAVWQCTNNQNKKMDTNPLYTVGFYCPSFKESSMAVIGQAEILLTANTASFTTEMDRARSVSQRTARQIERDQQQQANARL